MTARLEHANFSVSNPAETAAWMEALFDWQIRWQGDALSGGRTIHVGSKDTYLALYAPKGGTNGASTRYEHAGSLNHIAVVVDDLDATEAKVKAHGFITHSHQDYEPGRRFYFQDTDRIEYEVVQYE